MRKFITSLSFFFLIVNLAAYPLFAQENPEKQDIKKDKVFKNTVRFNLTNPIIFGDRAMIFGYERVLGQRQSFSINIGRATLPKLSVFDINSNNPSVQLKKGSTEKGINVSVDYRFYLNKVNRYPAPRGVYIAPYYSYNHFERENTWTLNTDAFQGDVITDFKLNIHTVGCELGYQFVLWKRLALDFILIGPGIANYSLKTNVSTTLDADSQAELFQKINDALANKIPGYSFVINDQEYKKSGRAKTTSFGFRYMIHLGFRF
jgi:hypothetical protein